MIRVAFNVVKGLVAVAVVWIGLGVVVLISRPPCPEKSPCVCGSDGAPPKDRQECANWAFDEYRRCNGVYCRLNLREDLDLCVKYFLSEGGS